MQPILNQLTEINDQFNQAIAALQAQLDEQAVIVAQADEHNPTLLVERFHLKLAQAEAHLQEIEQAITAYQQQGVYSQIPRVATEDGDKVYHYFKQDRQGHYLGPDGKRKVYIGNNPKKIAKAEQMVKRTQAYFELLETRNALNHFISGQQHRLQQILTDLKRFSNFPHPRVDLARLEATHAET